MKSYVFPVTLEPDEDGWRAFYPPLEHVGASTWGASREEALTHMQDVLTMIVDEFEAEGKEIETHDEVTITDGAAITITR